MKIVTAAQMRDIDSETINNRGIPGPQLMENAGRGIAEGILDDIIETPNETTVAVFCGTGNNGGDGYVVGRYLSEAGVNVTIYWMGPEEKLSDDAKLNHERAVAAGIRMEQISSPDDLPATLDADLVIDAIFGTGFSGSPRGFAADVIEYMNLQTDTGIISVDMPSGLNADDGQHEGAVVEADHTYTLALPKYGLYISPGRELSGTVTIVPIGTPDNAIEKFNLKNELITPESVIDLLPPRPPDAHKGIFGKLFILASSKGLTGAAAMAAMSANRTGCGLTKLGCPHSEQPVLAAKLTEIMTVPLPDVAKKGAIALRALGEVREMINQHDAIIIGPGMGTHHETRDLVRRVVKSLDKPAIIDADGLNNLAGVTEIIKECKAPLVLTPHPGEFKRLTGDTVPDSYLDKADLARRWASDLGAVIVLKGSPTIVADPEDLCYFNQTGNSGMATGGSGDVLSGMVGSLLAQGLSAIDAARCAVFIHGFAGDIAADTLTERSMVAGDLITFLPSAFAALEGRTED